MPERDLLTDDLNPVLQDLASDQLSGIEPANAPRLPFADESEVGQIEVDDLFEYEGDVSPIETDSLPSQLPHPTNQQTDSVPQPARKRIVPRSVQLTDGVQLKVVQHIEYGKSLARRGAVFGAKNEFHSALRLVAQAMDYQLQTERFTDSLFRALVAIEEADDFYFAQGENNGRVDVVAIGFRHDSKILNRLQLENMTPVEAMQAYYNFVQENLVYAGGKTIVASEALFCLGKLYSLRSKNVVEGSPLDNAKAIVHHRSAVECDVRNYKSANELAVLLVRSGRFEQAKQLLVHSLKIKQIPAAWENLSLIHQQLGENRLANLAKQEHQRMLSAPPSSQQINWVSPEQFAAKSVDPVELRTADASSSMQPANSDKQNHKSFKNMLNRLF